MAIATTALAGNLMPTEGPARDLLATLDGAEAVTVTPSADGREALLSVWNGGATVNVVGLRLAPGGVSVLGFDVWTNYELEGLTLSGVVDRMRDAARADLDEAGA